MIVRLLVVAAGYVCASCALLIPDTPARPDGLIPHHADGAAVEPLRRVVALPLAAEDGDAEAPLLVGRSLRTALARQNLFELLPVEERDLADIEIERTRTEGIYRTDDLIAISRRFGADGVLHGVLTEYAAYPTVRLGLRLTLLDCRTGRVPWAVDVILDAGDRLVEQDAHNWHDVHLRSVHSLIEHERVLLSPRLFADYAAARIAETLEEALLGPAEPRRRRQAARAVALRKSPPK